MSKGSCQTSREREIETNRQTKRETDEFVERVWTVSVILLMPEQIDVYYLFYKMMFFCL